MPLLLRASTTHCNRSRDPAAWWRFIQRLSSYRLYVAGWFVIALIVTLQRRRATNRRVRGNLAITITAYCHNLDLQSIRWSLMELVGGPALGPYPPFTPLIRLYRHADSAVVHYCPPVMIAMLITSCSSAWLIGKNSEKCLSLWWRLNRPTLW